MNKQRVLVVGAGALGITTALFLQRSGGDISFLVRPHRVDALSRPLRLYSYNDHEVKTLADFRVFSAASDLEGESFDIVLLTLDGATCRGAEGVATLTRLGKALAGSNAMLVICGVGVGLYEHVQQVTGVADTHLLQGTMAMFAYQVGRAAMPLPPPVNVASHDSTDIAFFQLPKQPGFIVCSKPGRASRAFAALYGRGGEVHCQRLPTAMYSMFTNSFFPFTIASEIDGWRGTDALIANRDLWQLCCQSRREIIGLRRHGLAGRIFSRLMGNARQEKMMREAEENSRPIGFTAFNRFHHGGKVLQQDVQVVQNCLAEGEADGRDMSATRALLQRWRALQAS